MACLQTRLCFGLSAFGISYAVFVDSSRVRIAGQPTKKSLRIVGAHLLQAQDLLRELEARCGAPVGLAMLKFPSLHKCISVDCEVVFLVDTLLQFFAE